MDRAEAWLFESPTCRERRGVNKILICIAMAIRLPVAEIASELPVSPSSVRQAILNLLINACNAAPSNGMILLSARTMDDNLVIEVGDTDRECLFL